MPLSHPFVERLIGTIRREYLDRTLFWTTADLETKLLDFQHYYNGHRTHAGLEGRLPEPDVNGSVSPIGLDSYKWRRHCRGLYQTPIAAMILSIRNGQLGNRPAQYSLPYLKHTVRRSSGDSRQIEDARIKTPLFLRRIHLRNPMHIVVPRARERPAYPIFHAALQSDSGSRPEAQKIGSALFR